MSLIARTPGGSAQFLSGAIIGDGVIAPGLSGTVNNLAPDGVQGSTVISLRAQAAITVTGMQAAPAFTIRWLKNDTLATVTLADANAGSAAANRLNLGGANLLLAVGASAGFIYNGLTTTWDLFTVSANAGAPSPSAVSIGPVGTLATVAGPNAVLAPTSINIGRLQLNTAAGAGSATGLTAPAIDGQLLLVTNLLAAGSAFTFTANAGGATQFYNATGGDLTLDPGMSQLFVGDSTLGWLI